ncbi:MAG: tetratricopeptide repeat protein [Alphaproteobacteria bacterium]|nr:tetratricopeptide repeat protein [Alphaproteobacteria bacterium]
MTESSLFQEIDEDLQRQKLEAMWKRYGHYIIGAALAIVLATALFSGWRSWRTYSEQKATAGLLGLVEGKIADKAQQVDSLESFARVHAGASQAFLAHLQAASIALKDGKTDRAVAIYDAMANDMTVELPFRQLADLLSVQAQLDTGEPAALQARLQPLETDSPWRVTAKEFTALLALRAGDKEKAKTLYTELSKDASAPHSMIQRATDMARWLNEGS